ncbi:hypothetical protein CHS0354_036083 [Potamilus streckersoni]|uniref:Battenin n=1 Tax=Potamilus streckersoni TaxID=2493646 RepID=A0AAE0SUP8_9BIVA|nr:hypothetical protein CHS0354_036083 [Potamilus streckersoni]
MDMFFIRNWIGLFILGAINNLPYVIVTSAAKTIADRFEENNLVGLVFGANVALNVVVKVANTFLLKTSYSARYVANSCLMLIGLFGVAYAFSFWFALLCIVFVGASSAFGENVALGYLKHFPSKLVNAWSSGTGMAGVLGSGIYIIFGCVVGPGGQDQDELSRLIKYAFLLTTPSVVLYLYAYFGVIRRPKEKASVQKEENGEREPLFASTNDQSDEIQEKPAVTQNLRDTLRKVWTGYKRIAWISFNLAAVYMFEYVAQGCAAKVRPHTEYNASCPELFAGIALCYQAGVFVSRSSVQLYQIRKIEILTVLQFFNMVLWVMDVHWKFLPTAVLPALMIFVGLLGGASYVNIFYLLLNDRMYEEDRELLINMAAIFITLGIIMGTAFETLLFSTILSND